MKTFFYKFSGFILFLFSFYACSVTKKMKSPNDDLNTLVSQMKGSYNSSAQSKSDTSFFDITLRMQSIWEKKESAERWLYVEQAVTANQQKPYRQRVYKVEQVDNQTFKSSVYLIKDEKKFIGAWKTPEMFDTLSVKNLDLKDGCAVYLTLDKNGNYAGATREKGCESTLRGAAYATSEVTVTPKGIKSWDRGFDKSGKQMWGAVKSGYDFVKLK